MKIIFKVFIKLIIITVISTPVYSYPIFFENVEGGVPGWTTMLYSGADNLWHPSDIAGHDSSKSFWCGINGGSDYDTGNRINTALVSPSIDLTSVTVATLSFWENYNTEPGWDYCMVDISINSGASWINLRGDTSGTPPSSNSGGWTNPSYNISAYSGNVIKIRFYFDTGDGFSNAFPGWYIDDIWIGPRSIVLLPTPQWISAKPVEPDKVELVWASIPEVTSYTLYRSTTEQNIGPWIASFTNNQTNYTDSGLECERPYYYRIRAFNATNFSLYSEVTQVNIEISLSTWAVLPTKFNPNTDRVAKIFFGGETPEVEVKIYDIFGNLVRFWSMDIVKGNRHVEWDGKDQNGIDVNAGIYIVYIEGKDIGKKKIRMMLVK